MSAPWQHNYWFWIAAACAVGGVAALWSPANLTLERHGEAITQGRPASVDRVIPPTPPVEGTPPQPTTGPLEAAGLAFLADQVQEETPVAVSSNTERQPYIRHPRHPLRITPVEHEADDALHGQATAVLTLPDRLDNAALRQVEGRSYVTRTGHALPTSSDSQVDASTNSNRPMIIARPSSRRSESTTPGSPVRLKGTIVPDQH